MSAVIQVTAVIAMVTVSAVVVVSVFALAFLACAGLVEAAVRRVYRRRR